MTNNEKKITTYSDLRVYKNLYDSILIVHNEIVVKLPKEEQYDLVSQMRRASKAAPALIAEGFAKRFHKKHWEKYLNDAMGETYEMLHHLTTCVDLYSNCLDVGLCKNVIDDYDFACKQITKLKKSWAEYHKNNSAK